MTERSEILQQAMSMEQAMDQNSKMPNKVKLIRMTTHLAQHGVGIGEYLDFKKCRAEDERRVDQMGKYWLNS